MASSNSLVLWSNKCFKIVIVIKSQRAEHLVQLILMYQQLLPLL